jgi:CHAD domain-containing protein
VKGRPGSVERERKLAAGPDLELPELDHVIEGVVAVPLPDQHLEAVYVDTPDLRLARAGITVRFRTGEGRSGKWTVKLPEGERGPALARREVDVVAPRRRVPAGVASLVRGHVRSAALGPVGTLRTHRRRVELRDAAGAVLAEVADDDVSVVSGDEVTLRFRELEVELTDDAPPKLLASVVRRLTEAGAVDADQTPKIVRALGARALEPPDVVTYALDPDEATVGDVVAAAMAAGFTRLLRHDPGVRLGGDDEDVHQARVAARRLRSDLRTFRSVVDPAWAQPLREELSWLGERLGRVRDADVLLTRLRAQAAALPPTDQRAATALLARLEGERESARADLIAVFDGDRYVRLLDQLADAAVAPRLVDDEAGARARRALPALVRSPWKHLQHAVEALGDDPEDAALHEIRIRAKRLRYAAEAAAPVIGKRATRLAKAAAALQTVLGDLQDAVVADAWLRAAGGRGPAGQALVAGQLVAVQRQAMAEVRREWRAAWDDLDAKKLRDWLR